MQPPTIRMTWSGPATPAAAARAVQALAGATMGTRWSVKLVAEASALASLQRGIQACLDEVVAQMSTWEPDSDLSRYNRGEAGSMHALPDGFAAVLDAALKLAADSHGAYDPTVGPLVNLWGFGPEGARETAPDDAAIAQAQAHVGWQRVGYDPHARTAVQPGGAYLDFSSIAKGYGVDRVAQWLREQGIEAFLVEVGGELYGQGRKPDGSAWQVAVERPSTDEADESTQAVLALDSYAIATSGDYRRYFDHGGQRYSHTVDPRSGRPVTHALAAVTVLHPQCMQADGLATVLAVLGPQAGMAYANQRQLAAMFVLHDGDGFLTRMTPAFIARQRAA
ncbi:FAD:protein FMN transferase [Lysobacter silvisoli]|uniref:FAD:protein FMN transferase n=1 Tax=Lysobacter silvisoli TaxID=2293254 RepID=A0A371K663_9GAMM|nr:FAD:protein FMN transferase [Lysobacter silvisoli]RDZ29354.1 FAD:protein FMN transferase [Lysobacter silvisoli]